MPKTVGLNSSEILDRLKVALEGVTEAAGYPATIRKASVRPYVPASIPMSDLPYVSIRYDSSSWTAQASAYYRQTMVVELYFILRAVDDESMQHDWLTMVDAVKACIFRNKSFGGYASGAVIVQDKMYLPSSDTDMGSEPGTGMVIVNIDTHVRSEIESGT